jgi:ATP-dependent RNA helicase DDX28
MIVASRNYFLRNLTSRTPCLFLNSSASNSTKTKKRIPLVTCKNKQLNLFLNEDRIKEKEIVLASKGWQHYKAKGDHFTIHPTADASDILKDGKEFNSFGLEEKLVQNLEEKHDITIATKLQMNAMEEIFNDQHVLLAAETGCGKVISTM